MIKDLQGILSRSAKSAKKSVIRELLKLTQRPEIISFAGGLPAPESFPLDILSDLATEVLKKDGVAACQYSTTEGDNGLRKALIEKYRKDEGLELAMENIIITTSSQQALDFLGRVFVDPGDAVICGLPTYLGGLQAFNAYGAVMHGIKLDEHGMRADLLKAKLEELKKAGKKPKFIYTVPDFQNPAGITMPEARRKEIIALAHEYDVLVVEDSPYRELRFEGKSQKMLYQLDGKEQVLVLGTFSKIFVPGFRIGWIIGNKDILDKFVTVKQSADLCTSSFNQKIAALYLSQGHFDRNIQRVIAMYREKRDAMLAALKEHMPKGVSWTMPEGGLFLFITLPGGMDAEKLFPKAIEKNVAYVLGSVFHCDGSGRDTMRLNFSFAPKEKNVEGIRRLAEVIKEEMKG